MFLLTKPKNSLPSWIFLPTGSKQTAMFAPSKGLNIRVVCCSNCFHSSWKFRAFQFIVGFCCGAAIAMEESVPLNHTQTWMNWCSVTTGSSLVIDIRVLGIELCKHVLGEKWCKLCTYLSVPLVLLNGCQMVWSHFWHHVMVGVVCICRNGDKILFQLCITWCLFGHVR